MSDDYKVIHESFVSNHNGTTSLETSTVNLPVFLSTFLIQVLIPWTPGAIFTSASIILDFIINVIPQIAVLTSASDHIFHVVWLQVAILSVAIFRKISTGHGGKNVAQGPKPWTQLTFVSHFRATLLIVTAISILAVDFPVFPRRFAKTEISGFGLMDIGVGMFVVSNGIVSHHARQKENKIMQKLKTIWGEFKGSVLMMIAAAVRFLSTTSVDYHKHDSEYGVHWNFFCTLAVVKIGSACVLAVVPRKLCLKLSLGFIMAYQYMLDFQGIRNYLLEDNVDTNSLIYLNRGGVYSCFGYLAIYFASVELGIHIFKPRKELREWVKFDIKLGAVSFLLWALLVFCDHYVDPVSRRTANVTYVIWVMMHSIQQLSLLLAADIAASYLTCTTLGKRKIREFAMKPCSSILLQAINKNGFFYFVLANLATGCVNLSMQTIFTGPVVATIVIFLYTVLLSVTVVVCLVKDKVLLRV